MTLTIPQMQMMFFGLLAFFAIVRFVAMAANRSKARQQEQRLDRLEQKVDAIMRHLNLSDSGVKFGASNSPWDGANQTTNTSTQNMNAGVAFSNFNGVSAEAAQLARSGNKIAAIKLHREQTGVGLKEAKDAIDQIA